MANVNFTEEPEEIPKGYALISSPGSAPQSGSALASGRERSDVRWDESKWAREILNEDCIKASQAKLDHRVASFLAVATAEEKESLSGSRDEFQRLVTTAIEASKLCTPDAMAVGPSVAQRLKHGLSATSAVAYEYVKILDVMVGQAPEYVGLAYGAIKILLVAQVNNEEVKEKVKGYLEQIQLKFEIIDHLTVYMPASRLVTLIAQVYGLFNTFVAKAIKHYTQRRVVRYLRAFTMPWKRFQDIVDSIESKLLSIKDVAQYVGLIEGHTTMIVSRQTLALLQQNVEKNQETKELVEEIRLQLEAMSLKFSKAEGVRQTADSLAKLAEERLNEPSMADADSSVAPESDIATHLSSTERIEDFDSWQNTLFPELRESSEKASRRQRANEELPNMGEFRSKRKSLEKSEIAMAWAESRKSEVLWINGNEVLSREDFNASFVCPLMLVGESNFDTFIKIQHFCQEASGETDLYVVMMQDLVAQVLRQRSSISTQQRATITRERTSTTEGLWEILLELIFSAEISCAFLLIGGIDHVVARSSRPGEMRAEIVHRFRALTNDTHKVVKIMVSMGFFQSTTASVENISSLVRARHPQNQARRLSLDGLQRAFPGQLMSQHLMDIQEGRCRNIAFTELPLLYTPGTMVYTQDNEKLRAFIVSEMSGMEPRPFGSFASLRLRVWSIDHDGQQICKTYQDLVNIHFVGRRDISSLTCIPSGYLQEEMTKRKHIISRGQKYWSYMSGVHYVVIHSPHGNQQGVVDQSARPINPNLLEGSEPLRVPQEATVKSRFLMLAPVDISVYAVRELKWSHVNLEKLEPLQFPIDALAKLFLPDKKKQLLVKAIEAVQIQTHHHQNARAASDTTSRSNTMDRLFFLFHGAPGTGKTLAAQCLANHAQRPLFFVTSGMKADKATFVDCLGTAFNLARRWDCLILMDHVETVLQQRSLDSFDRNAMVTEVLNLIDNYRAIAAFPLGILITTTDRVGAIDSIILSRTDLAVQFTLGKKIRRQIWTNGIIASGSQKGLAKADVDNILKIAKHQLNGHAITSILQSASRMAGSENRDINSEDIMTYIEANDAFSDYMMRLNEGYNPGKIAQGEGLRIDRSEDDAESIESKHGESEHGESEHGESEHGESEHGESEHGESERGKSNLEDNI